MKPNHFHQTAALACLGVLALLSGATPLMADPSGIVSDDFDACSIDPNVWQLVDPVGDASFAVLGAFSGDAGVYISMPAGSSHEPWTWGNLAPRLMQAANDTDFAIEVKFDAPLVAQYQMQGVIIEQDADDFLRFDFYSTGSGTRIFAGVFVDGSPTIKTNSSIATGSPLYMSISRTGDLWTLEYSYDGVDWLPSVDFTHAMTVAAVGPFAANGSDAPADPPAFTGIVDYFFNSAEPIDPEDGSPPGPNTTLTVNTTGDGVVLVEPNQTAFYCDELITLTAQPDPGWKLDSWGGDLSGSDPVQTLDMSLSRTVEVTFVPDDTPLEITNISVTPASQSAVVTWTSSKPATSRVDYGTTPAYELGNEQSGAYVIAHSIQLTNLDPSTEYHYKVTSVDEFDNPVSSSDLTFTTTSSTGPTVVLWYGDTQEFGQIGRPQRWVNVLGNASDPDGVVSMSYTLNGGPPVAMGIGPDTRRLLRPGDFNVEIDFDDLLPGNNQVLITAIDGLNNESVTPVTVVNSSGPTWPLPYSINWSGVSAINDVAQISDGKWSLEPNGVRPVELGYDRLIPIGDVSWEDYEITTRITVHSVDPNGFAYPSGAPIVGFTLRWPGHSDQAIPATQPNWYYLPLGAIGYYAWGQSGGGSFRIFGNEMDLVSSYEDMSLDVAYYWKMRVETSGSGGLYSLKVWEVGQPEPDDWKITAQTTAPYDPGSGSAVLIAHHVDARFGDVNITPIGPVDPLIISNVQHTPSVTGVEITWDTDRPATSEVAYGLTTSYELGTVEDPTLVQNHSVTLSDLEPNTLYHYQITSVDANDVSASTGDFTVTTVQYVTLALSISDEARGAVDVDPNDPNLPDYSYLPGTTVTLTAQPSAGEAFSGWMIYDPNYPGNINHAASDTNNPLVLTMDADWEVRAVFKCGGAGMALPPLAIGAVMCGFAALRMRRRG